MSQYDRYYNFSKPFIQSLKEIFYTNIESQVLVQDPSKKNNQQLSGDIHSLISIKGTVDVKNEVREFHGSMIISYPEDTFVKIVKHLKGNDESITQYKPEMLNTAHEIAENILELSIIELTSDFDSLKDTNISICEKNNMTFNYPLEGEIVIMEVITKFGIFDIEFSYVEE